MTYKTCGLCKERKLVSAFGHARGKPHAYCSPCKKTNDHDYYWRKGGREKIQARRQKNLTQKRLSEKAWRDKNKDRSKGKLLQQYWPGSSWQQALALFKALVLAQNNLCAVCRQPETRPSKAGCDKAIRDLCVDHCHTTGVVRGLLCDACNVMIALAKDRADICRAAACYLEVTHASIPRTA